MAEDGAQAGALEDSVEDECSYPSLTRTVGDFSLRVEGASLRAGEVVGLL